MSESHLNSPSGANQSDPGGNGGDGGTEKPKSVSYDTYQKTVNQEKTLRQKLQETQEKLLIFENEKRSIEEQKMLEEKKHVEFIEKLKQEKAAAEEKASRLAEEQRDFRKITAAMGLLQEKGISLESKYLGLLPLDQIQFTDDGAIDHTSVAEAVSIFQKEHPRLTLPAKAFLPSDKPGSSAQKMSIEEWKKLPFKEKGEALKAGRVNHSFKF